MGNLLGNLFANKTLFLNLFNQASKNVVEMASLLVTVVNTDDAANREPMFKQLDKMEHAGDDITHKIYLCLDKVILTPINRNDIHTLASTLDDVADTIQEASGRMYLYDIVDFVPAIKEIASLILKASIEIEKAVNLLWTSKNSNPILELCRQIKNYERQSDQVYYHAVAELFANEKDAIRLLKYREILFSLETSVNKSKNAADVLSTILMSR